MATQKPGEWVQSLITRFDAQVHNGCVVLSLSVVSRIEFHILFLGLVRKFMNEKICLLTVGSDLLLERLCKRSL